MKQILFEWYQPGDPDAPNLVVLEAETTETVVALMASALAAVVLAAKQAEETVDER